MKVGVFDSGLGGLTVVKSILNVFKGAQLFYIADTAYAPYGQKTPQEILNRCDLITEYLLKKYEIEALIVACNTATSAAIKHLRSKFPFLIIIGTEPGVKPAINITKSAKIGVMATPATLKGDKYQLLVNELSSVKKVQLFECACVGLVEQIENGHIQDKKTFEMIKTWLTPMKENGVDTIVLGCTHYPLIEDLILDVMGDDINIIQTGDAIANRLLSLSIPRGHLNEGELIIDICHTGEIKLEMINRILENKYKEIRKCEI